MTNWTSIDWPIYHDYWISRNTDRASVIN